MVPLRSQYGFNSGKSSDPDDSDSGTVEPRGKGSIICRLTELSEQIQVQGRVIIRYPVWLFYGVGRAWSGGAPIRESPLAKLEKTKN